MFRIYLFSFEKISFFDDHILDPSVSLFELIYLDIIQKNRTTY